MRRDYPDSQAQVVDVVRLLGRWATAAAIAAQLGRSKQSVTVSAYNAARHGRLEQRTADGVIEWRIPDRGPTLW